MSDAVTIFFEVIAAFLAIFVVLPAIVYIIVKMGVYAFFIGKRRAEEDLEPKGKNDAR